jgi:prepilin-type N-terminal cleavage/methylation domain-containing protein
MRPAFTLLEVVLVLAILVVLGAMLYPSMEAMYGGYRVTAAVDMVRAAWAEAQSRAVNEGRPYRFSVRLNSFRVEPESADASANNDETSEPFEDTLPKRVSFTISALAGPNDQDPGMGSGPIAGSDSGSWTPVVTFLPDGTARDDVEITFYGPGLKPQTLKLRALTGTAIPVKAAVGAGGRP